MPASASTFCSQNETMTRWTLILGLAFVFGYFGIDKFFEPLVWIGWLPSWMDGLAGMTKDVWLQIIGATEVLIAIALLIPSWTVQRWAALVAGLHLTGILTQVGWNDVAVRDCGLLCMASALWTWPVGKRK